MFLFISPFDDINYYNKNFISESNLIYLKGNTKDIIASAESSNISEYGPYHIPSLEYADYLLYKSELPKATAIINTVISYQNTNTTSETYGSFSFSSELLSSQRIYTIIDTTLSLCINMLQILSHHRNILGNELTEKIRTTCHNSSMFIIKNAISYTPHSLGKILEAYYFIMYSELFRSTQFFNHALTVFNNYYTGVIYNGFFWEYGALYEIYILSEIFSELKENYPHPEYSKITDYLYDKLWEYISNNFHSDFFTLTGPKSEIHRIFTTEDFSKFIRCALNDTKINSLTPIISKCPEKYKFYFSRKNPKNYISKHISRSSFKSAKAQTATNYIRPYYTIGSFDSSSFWYAYNPVQGYFKSSSTSPYKFELKVINEDHDFSSASLNCIQYKNNILGHISFFTNHGNRHYVLTPINGKIYTTNFRIRFLVTGSIKNLKIIQSKNTLTLKNEYITLSFDIPFIKIGDFPIKFEMIKEKNALYFDAVIVNSESPVEINFQELSFAICQFIIHITSSGEPANTSNYSYTNGKFTGTMNVNDNILKLETNYIPDNYEYANKNKKQYINDINLIDHVNTTAFLAAQNNYTSSSEENLPSYIIERHSEIYTAINNINEISADMLVPYSFFLLNKIKEDKLSITLSKSIVTEMINKVFDLIIKTDFSMQKYIDRNFFNIYQNINSAFSIDEISNIIISCIENLINTLDKYKKDTSNAVMTRIISIIDTEYQNSALSLSYIAEKTNANKTYINRLFKKNMNTTYKKYLTSIRLENAKKLLSEQKHTIDEVISLCGYNCYSSFKQAFKEYTKMSISAWIEENK